MRYVSLALGSACLAAAVLAAAFAHDVRSWSSALDDGDVQLRVDPARRDTWRADTWLPFSAAERALGIGDDLEFRSALRYFVLTRPRFGARYRFGGFNRPVEAARQSMRRVRASDMEVRRRSAAANYLGVLTQEMMQYGDEGPFREALRHFRDAVRIDPTNEEAKFNFELLLQRTASPGNRGGGGGGGREIREAEGAAGSRPGRGY